MPEVEGMTKEGDLIPADQVAAAGYVNPFRSVDEFANHRRITDGVLHTQYPPRVYPFRNQSGKHFSTNKKNDEKVVSMYESEFVLKPLSSRKYRPSSINRRNNPHPNVAFHVKHMLNQRVPVVRTRMTLEEFNRKPLDSPYLSNTHRVYRRYKSSEIDRAKPLQQSVEIATGIVPELNKPETSETETKLFPVIPWNTRLSADRAQKLTNAVIKPKKNKYQPHLTGATSSISEETFPYLPIKDLNKPGLKPCVGYPDSLKTLSWDGAPASSARTTSQVFGRKRADKTKVETAAQTVVPELPTPTSKSLMFKEYAQFPKYAPQMIQDYYSGKTRKNVMRPYVH